MLNVGARGGLDRVRRLVWGDIAYGILVPGPSFSMAARRMENEEWRSEETDEEREREPFAVLVQKGASCKYVARYKSRRQQRKTLGRDESRNYSFPLGRFGKQWVDRWPQLGLNPLNP